MLRNRNRIEGRVGAARALRRRMTPTEVVLWEALRDRKLDGLKFRRQHVMGPYVLDFCCPEAWLVIELDGMEHEEEEIRVYDGARTEFLNGIGYRVVRFRNDEVMGDLAGVLRRIVDEVGWSGLENSPHPRPFSLAREKGVRTDCPRPRTGEGAGGEGCV